MTVVHIDRSSAVLAPDEELAVGDEIAMNSGYQLMLTLKNQQSGGGSHHHHH